MIHRFTQTAVIEVKQQCAGQHFVGAPEMLHPTVERGNKAVVGAGCLVAQATSIGDRTSVKRSVVGASCKCVLSQCQGAPCSGEFPLLHGCTPVRATVPFQQGVCLQDWGERENLEFADHGRGCDW